MDQTPYLNQGQITNNSSQAGVSSSSHKKNIIVYFVLIALAVVLGVGGFFLGLNFGSKTIADRAENLNSTVTDKYSKVQDLIEAGGNIVQNDSVRIIYKGKLVAFEPGRSWILEKDGKSVTISRSGSEKTFYHTVGQDGQSRVSNEGDLKNGDEVSVGIYVDPSTGNYQVSYITVFREALPVEASPGSTDNP